MVELNFAINIFSIYIGEGGAAGEARGEAEEAREAGARGRKTEEAAEPLLPVLPGPEEEGGGRAPPGARRAAQQEGADQNPGGEVESAAGRGTEGQYRVVMVTMDFGFTYDFGLSRLLIHYSSYLPTAQPDGGSQVKPTQFPDSQNHP